MALACTIAGAGCGSTTADRAATRTPDATEASAAPVSRASVTDNTWTDSTSPTAIPLGDGKLATEPRVGYVMSCTSRFRRHGALHTGPWVNEATGTWDLTAKLAVSGAQRWPAASYEVSVQGTTRVITTNALPNGLPTGAFPISASDPAHQYDTNPNSIDARETTFRVPATPERAPRPTCTSLGPIGVTTVGALLFNGLDAAGRDAGAHEMQDACHGHPNGQDEYHYHSISGCLMSPEANTSELVGYAADGFGIYAAWNARGELPTNADLDACHGRTSTVTWDGERTVMYHYEVTLEYPYTVGCFAGVPARTARRGPDAGTQIAGSR